MTETPSVTRLGRGRRFHRLAAALILLGASGLLGCFDHRRAVAFRTLIMEDGRFHQDAYSAAIQARFPPGSPVKDLRQYVADSKGHCNEREDGSIWCEIPLRGAICWAELAGIEVTHSEGTIKNLRVIVGGLSC